MIDSTSINSVFDADVIDRDGEKVGAVKQIYVDNDSGRPLFASVATGLFGTSESFIPLQEAVFDGDILRIPYDKAAVKDAPRIDADAALTEGEEDRLWDYYAAASADRSREETAAEPNSVVPGAEEYNQRDRDGLDPEGTEPDETEAAPRLRLRKYVVIERQSIAVPLEEEERELGHQEGAHRE